jgi:2-amino-4-hydroxy-6-hydroxymethyldihydropteridine diphosphokinase
MVTAYVALGANLGDAAAALRQAIESLQGLPSTVLGLRSALYKTAPLDSDCADQPRGPGDDYINAVVQLETTLSAPALLVQLQQIEQQAGRQRPYRNAPRTLDLDLLLYGSASIASEQLSVPHPRMWQRAFVLVPLAEIAPDLVSPAQLQAVADQAIERLA